MRRGRVTRGATGPSGLGRSLPSGWRPGKAGLPARVPLLSGALIPPPPEARCLLSAAASRPPGVTPGAGTSPRLFSLSAPLCEHCGLEDLGPSFGFHSAGCSFHPAAWSLSLFSLLLEVEGLSRLNVSLFPDLFIAVSSPIHLSPQKKNSILSEWIVLIFSGFGRRS